MTLLQIVDKLQTIGLSQPNVRTAGEGNIYDFLNNNPSVKYGVFFITQNSHIEYEDNERYGLTLFYVDRLEDDMESNRLRIQSHGKQVLSNILTMFCNSFDIDFPEATYTSFTQKFVDECAGCYVNILIEIYKDTICEDGESPVWEKIGVLQNKDVTITENGDYDIYADAGYDGIKSVNLTVSVVDTDCFQRGYNSGHTDGMADQKALLSSTALTENGTYTSENGFSAVTVSVHPNTTNLTTTVNGEFTPPSGFIGYSAVTVNVNSGDCLSNEFLIEVTSDYLETVTGVQITVTYADQEDVYTYNGEPLLIAIYPGTDYVIEFGNLDHHIAPNAISGTSRWNASEQISVEYKWISACYVDPESILFEQTGGSATIDIVADGAWTASCVGDWYVQTTTTGTGDGTINLSATGNNTGDILEGYVNITFYDNTTGSTYVSQKPLIYLDVDEQYILFEHSGSSYHLAVSSNTDYTITAPSWITYEYVDNLLVLTASDLGNTQGRHDYVVFTYDGFEKAISVNQVNPDYVLLVSSAGTATTTALENGAFSTNIEIDNKKEVYVGSDCTSVSAMHSYESGFSIDVLWFDEPSTSITFGECAFGGNSFGLLVIPKNATFYNTSINRTAFCNVSVDELRLNSNISDGQASTSYRTLNNNKYAFFRCHPFLDFASVGVFKIGPDVTYLGKSSFSKEDPSYRAFIYPSRIELYGKPTLSINSYREEVRGYSINGNAVDTFVTNSTSEIHVPSAYTFYGVRYCIPTQIEDITVPEYIREKFV